jgi:hypothetical protein
LIQRKWGDDRERIQIKAVVRKVDVRNLALTAAGRASGFALLRLALVRQLAGDYQARGLGVGWVGGELVGDVTPERIVVLVVVV